MSMRRTMVAGTLLLTGGIAFCGCFGSDDTSDSQRPEDLVGRTFVSTSIIDGGAPRDVVPDTEITMSIEAEGRQALTWNAGCNSFGADVEVAEDRFLVGRVGGTLMGCPGNLGRQEATVSALFEADPKWRLTGDGLLVSSGETAIRFTASPEATDTAGTPAKRLEAVRRSPRGLGREPPSSREVALAERIMAANAFLARIADDGGGYTIADIGLIQTAGPDRILGLTAIVRLEHPVHGIYELPVTCHGVSGPPFALPATTFNFDRVSRLIVDVSFADRRIASISPHNGDWRPEPGAAYLSVPSTCERRTQREIGP